MDETAMKLGEFVLGLILGIATNLISWWILFHWIVPCVHFSPSISKTSTVCTSDDKSGYRYRIKFENAGRRSVIDLELMAWIRIKGIGTYKKTTWQVIQVPLDEDGSLNYRIPRLRPVRTGRQVRHIIRLHINSAVKQLDRPPYPEQIRSKARSRELLMEDLLNLGDRATLEVQALGYDEFSGTRKLFLSKLYTTEDIREGPFDKKGLEVRARSPRDLTARNGGAGDNK